MGNKPSAAAIDEPDEQEIQGYYTFFLNFNHF
jgi:hypothetical protein